MKKNNEILDQFVPISLEKLLNAKLMNRVDTKFLIHQSDLPQVLNSLNKVYNVLEVNNKRISKYENLYFDTPEHRFYLDHHNRKDHRFKVRFRKYENSQTSFFEIKERRKYRTDKHRIQVEGISEELEHMEIDLVSKMLNSSVLLEPKLMNHYQRITLVSEELKERFTLDLEVTFINGEHVEQIDNVIIAELKQQIFNRNSPVFEVMSQLKIQPFRISKYCIGTVLLYPNEGVKYNSFKYIIQKLNKYKNAD